jgi:hypothetical protein
MVSACVIKILARYKVVLIVRPPSVEIDFAA